MLIQCSASAIPPTEACSRAARALRLYPDLEFRGERVHQPRRERGPERVGGRIDACAAAQSGRASCAGSRRQSTRARAGLGVGRSRPHRRADRRDHGPGVRAGERGMGPRTGAALAARVGRLTPTPTALIAVSVAGAPSTARCRSRSRLWHNPRRPHWIRCKGGVQKPESRDPGRGALCSTSALGAPSMGVTAAQARFSQMAFARQPRRAALAARNVRETPASQGGCGRNTAGPPLLLARYLPPGRRRVPLSAETRTNQEIAKPVFPSTERSSVRLAVGTSCPLWRTAGRAAPWRARAAVTRDHVGDGAACDDR